MHIAYSDAFCSIVVPLCAYLPSLDTQQRVINRHTCWDFYGRVWLPPGTPQALDDKATVNREVCGYYTPNIKVA